MPRVAYLMAAVSIIGCSCTPRTCSRNPTSLETSVNALLASDMAPERRTDLLRKGVSIIPILKQRACDGDSRQRANARALLRFFAPTFIQTRQVTTLWDCSAPTNGRIAWISNSWTLTISDIRTGSTVYSCDLPGDFQQAAKSDSSARGRLVLSPDASSVYLTRPDGAVAAYGEASPKGELMWHTARGSLPTFQVQVHPVASFHSFTICFYDQAVVAITSTGAYELVGEGATINQVWAFHALNHRLVLVVNRGGECSILTYDEATFQTCAPRMPLAVPAGLVAYDCSHNTVVISRTNDPMLEFVNLSSGAVISRDVGSGGAYQSLSISEDGAWLLLGGQDSRLRILLTGTLEEIATLDVSPAIKSSFVDSVADYLVIQCQDRVVFFEHR